MGKKPEILVSERDFDFSMVEVTRTNTKTDLPKFESRGFKKVNVSFPSFKYTTDNTKAVGVVYSGGWDSTLLMVRNLEAGKLVQPIWFNFANDEPLRHIGHLILKNRYGKFLLPPIDMGNFYSSADFENNCCGQQAYIHFALGFLNIDSLMKLSEIQIGYVMNDDAISFLDELRKLTKTHFKIQHKAIVPVQYPLSQLSRGEVHYEVSDKLKSSCPCISCERPEITWYINDEALFMLIGTCGDCISCRKDKMMEDYIRYVCIKIPRIKNL